MKLTTLSAITLSVSLIAACGGGGGDTAAVTAPIPIPTPEPVTVPEPTPSPAPAPAPSPIPVACTAEPIGSTGYSLVFKGCSVANVAEYYAIDECIRDNTTGLIWQGQTAAGTGLRANNAFKTNFDSTTGNQNYNSGTPIPATTTQINAATNSIGFKNAVNATNLCGSSAWRMPSIDELRGIIRYGVSPSIDSTWFVNTAPVSYVTNTPYAPLATPTIPIDYVARFVNFADSSSINGSYRNNVTGSLVRLVH